jgi:cysteine desulfurase
MMTRVAGSRVYADHNATTPAHPDVVRAVAEAMAVGFGNAASVHRHGAEARRRVETARAEVAQLVNARPAEVVFTSGGTEADNLAVIGVARAARADSPSRRRVVVSAVEHHAVLAAADTLETDGYSVTRLDVTGDGIVTPDALASEMTDDVALVSVQWVNNDTGVIQPVGALAEVAHAAGARFHADAVQAPGRVEFGDEEWDVLSLSGHKVYGPPGVGAAVVRRGLPIQAMLVGGGQERGLRSGTVPVALVEGFGVACARARTHGASWREHLARLTGSFEASLAAAVPGAIVHGAGARRVPGTTSVSCPKIDAEAALIALDIRGVSASSGSACTTGAVEPSHVLIAMGCDPALAEAGLRFSFGVDTSEEEASFVADALIAVWTASTEREIEEPTR